MAINPEALLSYKSPEVRQRYTAKDAILYALGIGLGTDPLDEGDLAYLIETRLKVLPTFAVTLASPGMWMRDPKFGIDFTKLVHSAQAAEFHTPLPATAEVTATPRITSLEDRGEGRGAVLVVEREIKDASDDTLYCTVKQTLLLRGDGGFGGPPPSPTVVPAAPERAPDVTSSIGISPRAALIYRLSGDWNPLHAEPSFAKAAGFDRPILHGLASYGIAGYAIMRAYNTTLQSLECRFSGVVYPGDTLEFNIWDNADDVWFEATANGKRVLDKGFARKGVTL